MSEVKDPEQGEGKRVAVMLLTKEHLNNPEELLLIQNALKKAADACGMGVAIEDEETFLARGRVKDCDCQMLQCVCTEVRQHKPECRWRMALLAPIGFACEPHDREECPVCDACTCSPVELKKASDFI